MRVIAIIPMLLALATLSSFADGDRPHMKPTEAVQRDGLGNFFPKLQPGGELTIGYFGASVTNGAGATQEHNKWRWLVHDWLQSQYPETKLRHRHVVNGGTGGHLGASRLRREHLNHDPALIFIEFSVNDRAQPYEECLKTMEGMVRQVWRHDPTCDIIILHTLDTGHLGEYRKGELPSTPTAFEVVADHYGIPTIDVGWVASQKLIADELTWDEFSIDTVHPTDAGYKIYGDHIIACLDNWRAGAQPGAHAMPAPLRKDNWEDATMAHPTECTLSDGWRFETGDHFRHYPHFLDMMVADAPGETVSLRFNGTHLGVYHVVGPDSGAVEVFVDGQSKGKVDFWDRWCRGYRSSFRMLASDLPPGEHGIVMKILPDKNDNSTGHAVRLGFITLKGGLVR